MSSSDAQGGRSEGVADQGAPEGPSARQDRDMNTNVTDANGETIGYYFFDALSNCYIAVKATGERASAQRQFQARMFIEG